MTAQPDVQHKERDLIARCVGEAYEVLDLIPGVDPNGPVLVWLAERYLQLSHAEAAS
jgi:hypothetical protein